VRPFRSRLLAAIVLAVLALGLLGTVANADEMPNAWPEDPWDILS